MATGVGDPLRAGGGGWGAGPVGFWSGEDDVRHCGMFSGALHHFLRRGIPHSGAEDTTHDVSLTSSVLATLQRPIGHVDPSTGPSPTPWTALSGHGVVGLCGLRRSRRQGSEACVCLLDGQPLPPPPAQTCLLQTLRFNSRRWRTLRRC